jgi:hypothetical protein
VSGTNITMTSDANNITINGPSLTTKQDTLTAASATGAQSILSGTTVKCLKGSGGVTLSSDSTSITLSTNNINPTFSTSIQTPTINANDIFTIPTTIGGIPATPILQLNQSTKVNGILDVSQDVQIGGTTYTDTITKTSTNTTNIINVTNSDLVVSGSLNAGNFTSQSGVGCTSLSVNGPAIFLGTISSYAFSYFKPYISAYVLNDSINYQNGFVSNATLSRPNGAGGLYQFSWSSPHPRGTQYFVIAQIRTGSTAGQTFSICTTNVTSSTSFNVWVRNSTMGTINGDFYVYTVP